MQSTPTYHGSLAVQTGKEKIACVIGNYIPHEHLTRKCHAHPKGQRVQRLGSKVIMADTFHTTEASRPLPSSDIRQVA